MSQVNGEKILIDYALISKIIKDRLKDVNLLRGVA